MKDDEMKNDQENDNHEHGDDQGALDRLLKGLWRSPLGVFGVALTTVSIALMMIGTIVDLLGLIDNPYAALVTYTVLPAGMLLGLFLIPLAAFLRRRKWHKTGIDRAHLQLNLSHPKHRLFLVGFIFLSVVNLAILGVIGYEGYHFTDSAYFCGVVCHQVMEPEYVAYKRSPHSRVACVECHIGPGAEWYVRAKFSGLRQVAAVALDSYSRPIPAPVHELRPARDTCEQCHWPEKFHGKKVKKFVAFSNNDQINPQISEVALHIGGHNPETSIFEGIHWHVSNQVEVSYLAADDKRTQIAKVRVKRPDGSADEFVKDSVEVAENEGHWRVMDCVDCHNRPTHIYYMPEERVDFGLLSKKINGAIPGIREDSLTVITKEYASREEAKASMVNELITLQKARDAALAEANRADLVKAGEFLLEEYLGNVWPEMKVGWGTYRDHLGHRWADDGYGCWRCHDEEHVNKGGKTISQDCSICHDEPV
ncbi:MAG: NapC/NirT family cytochrome c [Thermodesulfobacteriota bacterium]